MRRITWTCAVRIFYDGYSSGADPGRFLRAGRGGSRYSGSIYSTNSDSRPNPGQDLSGIKFPIFEPETGFCNMKIYEKFEILKPEIGTRPEKFKVWDSQAWANIVDPDQTPQNAASDEGQHCLPHPQFYTH